MDCNLNQLEAAAVTERLLLDVSREEGLRPIPECIVTRALKLNEMMLKYPLDSIQNIDQRATSRTDTGILRFYRQLPETDQQVVSVLFKHNCTHIITISVISGCAVGATLPTAIGAAIGGPAGAFVAFLIGFPVTLILSLISGLSASAIQTVVQIKHDDTYIRWVEKAKMDDQYDSYVEHLRAYFVDCDDLFCPISQDFPKIACKCPNGYIYDRQTIEEYLDNKEDFIATKMLEHREQGCTEEELQAKLSEYQANVCPFRGPYYTKQQLVYDANFARVLRQKLSNFINDTPMIQRQLELGLSALIISLQRTENLIKSQKIAILTSRMSPLGISVQKQTEFIAEIMNS